MTSFRSSMAARVMAGASAHLLLLAAAEFHHVYVDRLTPVDGEAVADVASARRWRTLPGETDWLLKNGTPWLISR